MTPPGILSLVESSSVHRTLFRLLIGKIIILLSPSASIFGGRGRLTTFGCRYLRNFTIRCVYEQLKAIGSCAWSPKVLTIFAPCTEFLLALLCFLFLFCFCLLLSAVQLCDIFYTIKTAAH